MTEHKVDTLLQNKEVVETLSKSPEAQALMGLIQQNAQGDLKEVAQSAMKGDTTQLMSLMNRLMQDPKGAELVGKLKGSFGN